MFHVLWACSVCRVNIQVVTRQKFVVSTKMSTLMELRPDRDLLDSDFNGYKLSLDPVPTFQHSLQSRPDHLLPSDDQYSFLHAKVFGLHNHLYGDPWSTDDIYYIDNKWRMQKSVSNPNSGRLESMVDVWELPSHHERKPGHFNISMSFTSPTLAVVSDGAGTLHLIDTGTRTETTSWKTLYSDEVCGKEKGYIVVDSRLHETDKKRSVHCLLQHIDESTVTNSTGEVPLFKTILEWVTLLEGENNWSISSVRKLSSDGGFDYAAFEVGCESIYIASTKQFKFIIDSEHPVEMKCPMEPNEEKTCFSWQQTGTDITVWIPMPCEDLDMATLSVEIKEDSLRVALRDHVLLEGQTWQRIEHTAATWSVDRSNLELRLRKSQPSVRWEELVLGDVVGEQIAADPETAPALPHLTSDVEATAEDELCAPTFNTEQLEECDSLPDLSMLARLDTHSHAITHQVNLGGHQMLFTARLTADASPALCVRHDVDACLWQMAPPVGDSNDWPRKHVGTFLAFGYVQASKTQRKFSVCAPDMSYVAICEASRHLYLYRQPSAVNGELRNRTTGKRVQQVAKQQLVTLDLATEVLGVHASNGYIYVLTQDTLFSLQVNC